MTVAVERTTRASRAGFVAAILLVAALAALPWIGDAGAMRVVIEFITLLVLAQMWNLLAGYGPDADRDVIRAWWSLRSLVASRWLIEHGFDPDVPGCEFDVLRGRFAV